MTNEEWQTCQDPQIMLEQLKNHPDRKLRLFTVGCCRMIWDKLDEPSRHLVEVAEQYADGEITKQELDAASDATWGFARSDIWDAVWAVAWDTAWNAAWNAAWYTAWYAARDTASVDKSLLVKQADLIRHIFGKPS